MPDNNKISFYLFIHFRTWFRYTRRPHFAELSKFGNLNVIENPLAIFSGEFLKNVFKSFYFYFKYSKGIRKDERCEASIIRPLLLFSISLVNKYPLARKIDLLLLKLQMRKLQYDRKNNLSVYLLTDKTQDWLIQNNIDAFYVLDMNDEWSMIDYNKSRRIKIESLVRKLISKVDLVTAVTIQLKDKYNIDDKVHFLPNAVDVNHYVPSFDKTTRKLKEEPARNLFDLSFIEKHKNDPRVYTTNLDILKALKHPLVGSYSGLSGNWSDFAFMARVEELLPENFSMVSSGNIHAPTRPEFMDGYHQYIKKPRMIYLKHVDYSALPVFLEFLDVGIVMHRMDEFNKHSAPNKIWAYLAMGLPVVSTNFLTEKDKAVYEGMVKFASTPEEYVQAIIDSTGENSLELKLKRRNLAVKYSTENRAADLVKIIVQKTKLKNKMSNSRQEILEV